MLTSIRSLPANVPRSLMTQNLVLNINGISTAWHLLGTVVVRHILRVSISSTLIIFANWQTMPADQKLSADEGLQTYAITYSTGLLRLLST